MRKPALKVPLGFLVRDATLDDLSGIIGIVNSKNNRASFGFVPKVVLADFVNNQHQGGSRSKFRIRVVTEAKSLSVVAWVRAYHRNDGVTALHELGVAEDCQSKGIGSYLVRETVNAAKQRGMNVVRLKTPTTMRSNAYYPRFGFKHAGVGNGRKRKLNVYELPLN